MVANTGNSNEPESRKGSTVFMALRGEAVPEPAGAGPTDCKQSVTAAFSSGTHYAAPAATEPDMRRNCTQASLCTHHSSNP